ncbi:Vacuolar calcium ion transporter [Purpureocillium lavendulum]|uniref:Vacuolar calcium ion transporter n=1 Tax=Purpureocillium lavendulum TaxID=1247861 RepID=A0AB34G0J9_9HYPO|nr:Vacuolar calcium ion transporter [Purpureocillium lavendulum]
MCTTYIYTFVQPDGRREQVRRPHLCTTAAHRGQPCVDSIVLQHPTQYVQPSSLPSYGAYFPPTPPPYTPRSGTPSYRSGDESDRSYHSSSSNRRRSGVYVNGQRVLDLNRRDRDRHLRRERIVLVDNPPTPRTPPQTFNFPHTAPSSPNVNAFAPHIVDAAPRESYTRRPVIVDERPRAERPSVQIEVVEPRPPRRSNTHMRHSSTSSRESGRPAYTSAEEEEFRQRRLQREAVRQERRLREAQEREQKDREAREKTIRDQRMRQRIAEANAEIANRPAVPMPPAPKRASTFVGAKSAQEARDREADLIDAVRRLNVEEKRREKRAEREEDEEQRARLRERMVPRRRATVGPGSRRHRVLYDDGIYRWE